MVFQKTEHGNADALSRLTVPKETETPPVSLEDAPVTVTQIS